MFDNNYDDNPGTDKHRKYSGDEYFIRTPDNLKSKSGGENCEKVLQNG